MEIEAEHHADVEQRLIAHRTAAKQVLNGLLVAVARVRQFSLRQLFFDHRSFNAVERLFARERRLSRDGGLFHDEGFPAKRSAALTTGQSTHYDLLESTGFFRRSASSNDAGG